MKDYWTNDSGWKVGDRVKAFDSVAWSKTGDVENNDIYMRLGTIVKIYEEVDEYDPLRRIRVLADIKFDHIPDEVRKGKFLYGLKKTQVCLSQTQAF